ncbi:hypothetical protein C9994_06690 [Marivirga lumbricoides]|uniref:Multidrug transporter n=1 Tax=Marivirga lumbricoides TaxID=1046115 RepID=A0A2T4DS17_9BACT|nr:hypothetical protein C9994_06690 [Marivirga lumbricoides]
MKKFKLFTLLFVAIGFGFTACDDDDSGEPDAGVTITGIPATAEIENLGTLGPVTATLTAPDGLASFSITKDGAAFGEKVTYDGETTATVDFTYTATEEDEDNNIVFVFTATDVDGDEESFTHVLSVGEAVFFPNEVLSGLITEDITLTNDRIWELAGRVIVTGEATLEIEPGTIIKGRTGTGTNASVLMIARDGMIDAVGTAENPIIFTTVEDNIQVGQLRGNNLTVDDRELWGGVVILGNAPISPNAGTTAQIEGVPPSESLGQYGGDNAADNRGNFQFVSLRHGGTTIDPVAGNDINGLTLGGVGTGTTISDIEIFANFDDGVEFFGGTVNVSNVLVYTVGDDAIDIDQAYAGTVDNFLVFTSGKDAADSDEGLEIDGPEGAANSGGKFTVQNGTITSIDGGGSAADFKSSAQGTVKNVKWSGFTGGATIQIRASYTADDCERRIDALANLLSEDLVFETVEFGAISVYTSSAGCTTTDDQTAAEGIITSETATGASDATVFNGWTLASLSDLL